MSEERGGKKHELSLEIPVTKTVGGIIVIVAVFAFITGFSFANITGMATLRSQVNSLQNQPSAAAPSNAGTQPSTTGSAGTGSGTTTFSLPSFETPLGSSSAKINIVEFGDYQCPYCDDYFNRTEPLIKQDYVDTGKAKYYFLDFAFLGADSNTLAEGSWCANDQGKYWEYNTYMYANQGREDSGWGTPAKVEAMVKNISGINVQTFDSCLNSGKYQSRVQQNTQTGGNSGVSGTPAFLIGNNNIGYQLLVGDQPYSAFQQVINSQLQKAGV